MNKYIINYKIRETGLWNVLKLRPQSQKSQLKKLRLLIPAQIRESVSYILITIYFLCDIKNNIFQHKDVKLKTVKKLLNKTMEPKCQNKWELIYNKKVMWKVVWKSFNLLICKQKIILFRWKCSIHFIVCTDSRLQKMGKSNSTLPFM